MGKKEQFKAEWVPTGRPDTVVDGEYKEFRTWQGAAYDKLVNSDLRIINVPTGAGKSHAIKALGSKDHNDGKKVIIAVPYRNIAKGFGEDFLHLPVLGNVDFVVPTKWNLVEGSNQVEGSMVSKFIAFLKTRRGDRTLVCTHMTLVALYKELDALNRLDLLENTSTFIDEAHHIKQHEGDTNADEEIVNGIGGFVRALLDQVGIRLTLVTATFFRGDRLSVLPSGVEEQFTRYNLPYDEYLKQLQYLHSIRFNVILYTDTPADALRRELRAGLDKTVEHPVKSVVYIPSASSSYYRTQDTDKFAESESVLKAATRAHWKPVNGTDNLLTATTTNKGRLIAVDLVNDRDLKDREKAVDFIAENSKDWQNGPDLVVSLNMFKEGSDYPLASKGYVVGNRGSLNDIIQMLGRLLRDVEGKEEVEFNLLLPANRVKDEFREDANTYLNAMILSMLLEDVLAPPSLVKKEKSEKDDSDEMSHGSTLAQAVDGDIAEVERIITEVFEAAAGAGKGEFTNDAIGDILLSHGISEEYHEDVIKELKRKVAGRVAAAKKGIKLSEGIDCGDLALELMTAEEFAEGVRYLMSDAIGEAAFEHYRNYIIVNSDAYSEAQDLETTDLVADFYKAHLKWPSTSSDDLEEARLGRWLQGMRAANRRG